METILRLDQPIFNFMSRKTVERNDRYFFHEHNIIPTQIYQVRTDVCMYFHGRSIDASYTHLQTLRGGSRPIAEMPGYMSGTLY